MSANVETMMYVREKPWHGLGTRVAEAPTSFEAIRLAGLDWTVDQREIALLGENKPIKNALANVRSSDGAVLGLVSERYKIVQNYDAFAFTDVLIGGDVTYETAGSLNGGRKIWLLARMPKQKILDDDIEPYLCFTNTHDGTGAVRVLMTPIRVVCNNTLNLAISKAQRAWSVVHTGDIKQKIAEARETLDLANRYMSGLSEYAEKLTDVWVDEGRLQQVLDKVFRAEAAKTDREKETLKKRKDAYMTCYLAPDLVKYFGTAYGAVNAMADMVAHAAPARMTSNYAENNWGRIMAGHKLVDDMVEAFAEEVNDE